MGQNYMLLNYGKILQVGYLFKALSQAQSAVKVTNYMVS